MKYFQGLTTNIRFYVLVFSAIWAAAAYIYIKQTIPSEQTQTIRLTETYALTSLTYLYLALLATPLTRFFTFLPFRSQYVRARRAIGVSAFFFGLLHATNAFFFLLGGFEGLGFLSDKYLLAISLSFTALVILSLMAMTSFEFMVNKLTYPKWKMLHRLVY